MIIIDIPFQLLSVGSLTGAFFLYSIFFMNKPTTTQIIQAVLDVITAIGMALLAIFK